MKKPIFWVWREDDDEENATAFWRYCDPKYAAEAFVEEYHAQYDYATVCHCKVKKTGKPGYSVYRVTMNLAHVFDGKLISTEEIN